MCNQEKAELQHQLLEKDILTLRKESNDLRTQIKSKNTEIQTKNTVIQSLEKQMGELNQSLAEHSSHPNIAKDMNSNSSCKQCSHLQASTCNLEFDLAKLNSTIQELKSTNQELSSSLTTERKSRGEVQILLERNERILQTPGTNER